VQFSLWPFSPRNCSHSTTLVNFTASVRFQWSIWIRIPLPRKFSLSGIHREAFDANIAIRSRGENNASGWNLLLPSGNTWISSMNQNQNFCLLLQMNCKILPGDEEWISSCLKLVVSHLSCQLLEKPPFGTCSESVFGPIKINLFWILRIAEKQT